MGRYEAPAVLGTYSVDELAEEAATCESYITTATETTSDRELKDEIAEIGGAVAGIRSIRTE
jgi:hypothetical protein